MFLKVLCLCQVSGLNIVAWFFLNSCHDFGHSFLDIQLILGLESSGTISSSFWELWESVGLILGALEVSEAPF